MGGALNWLDERCVLLVYQQSEEKYEIRSKNRIESSCTHTKYSKKSKSEQRSQEFEKLRKVARILGTCENLQKTVLLNKTKFRVRTVRSKCGCSPSASSLVILRANAPEVHAILSCTLELASGQVESHSPQSLFTSNSPLVSQIYHRPQTTWLNIWRGHSASWRYILRLLWSFLPTVHFQMMKIMMTTSLPILQSSMLMRCFHLPLCGISS